MPTAKQCRLGTWLIRTLAPLALAAAVSPAAQASLAISAAPTSNVTCSGGACIATTTNAVLNATDLKIFLHRGDVRVDAGPANAIAMNATLNWTQGSRLTLAAGTGITVSQPIVVEGHGAVTLTTGDKSAGAIAFTGRGRLDFWDTSSSLVINDINYTLVKDLPALVQAIADDPHGSFALAKNYNAEADAPYTASPIYVLYGSLDGLGHAISNLKISAAQGCAGFIAYFVGGRTPSIANLTLSQIDVTQTHNSDSRAPNGVGGLAGCSQGTISHVRVTGHVNGPEAVSAGGLIGWQADGGGGTGPIWDSSVRVAVSGAMAAAGGIVGFDLYGSLLRCAAAGSVKGPDAGGLVGLAEWDFGNITQSWSSAHAIGPISGGLVGQADGNFTLADNYASGAVSSGGGLIGKNTGIGSSGNMIQRSYAMGVVHGGGVTGYDDGTGAYTNVYWDMDTTHVRNPANGVLNHPNYPGVTGLSDAQMKAALPTGFSPSVWGLNPSINNGYPYLLANPPSN